MMLIMRVNWSAFKTLTDQLKHIALLHDQLSPEQVSNMSFASGALFSNTVQVFCNACEFAANFVFLAAPNTTKS